ncbi:hypothetical protein MADA3029_p0111 [Vibrio nigripulchritudo MADA3029]|uniref:LysR family transcriptional regulator n=1 Tax=Vibrio nigripulchritudo TaxID=28173 RepID=UPI0003B1FE71|nr:LysR family transcriptional regulator [Vibrio nigripulchritudo]CCN38717.1 hypothetical protein VIBNIAM115_p0129 [Vibrio nigripulchritudo AM115]CCN50872.1 hypothetical protein VIBNIMADA3020_p0111 [Vibrio nigripulchritudo MADA3020]CCN56730.1 hypothetical protein VIBNIMADA3021_p0111 [Vibrio nigripulchritudo MADA3021]CCN62587.1 hypothetical protein MADA3029_p0111 [Vibrio nigripulchritudo MADA3029]CCN79783.1 hypothetical protein VIBNISO65_p0131 [Vibrio nigripulchritudo SO65]CCN92007.1 hypotheti
MSCPISCGYKPFSVTLANGDFSVTPNKDLGYNSRQSISHVNGITVDFNPVRYFFVLADTLNFTRAAEKCFVSQSALTQAIKR